ANPPAAPAEKYSARASFYIFPVRCGKPNTNLCMLKFSTTSDLFPARDLELRPAIPNFLPITSRSSHTANPWCGRMRIPSADSGLEFGAAAIRRAGAELGFDTQQAVVLRDAIGTAQRAGLDLARRRAHRQIGDSRILSFAGAMRNHCAVAGGLGHLDGVERFGQRSNLVELDQDRVGDTAVDTFFQNTRV